MSDRRPIAALFRATAHTVVAACVRRGISANTVSALSLAAGLCAGLALVGLGHPASGVVSVALLAATLLAVLRLWLNMLDGMVAIASGTRSRHGELWNELPDRVSDTALFLGVAHSGLCHPLLGYAAALAALAVAYVGTLGQAVGAGRRFEGWMSKPWRVATLLVGVWLSVLFEDAALVRTLTVIDLTLLVIVLGCVDSVRCRLRVIVRAG